MAGNDRVQLYTVWGEEIRELAKDPDFVPLGEYPRPQFVRAQYTILNGWWTCRFGAAAEWDDAERFLSADTATPILVPFSPEAALSGVGRTLMPDEVLWYRCTFTMEEGALPHSATGKRSESRPADARLQSVSEKKSETRRPLGPDAAAEESAPADADSRPAPARVLLHFGAVDQECRVWVNGCEVGGHCGGYLPFTLEITPYLAAGENVLQVLVRDFSDTGLRARGKQTLAPGGMWYSAQSGIWQSVWLETVPETYIADWRIRPDPDRERLMVVLTLRGSRAEDAGLPCALKLIDEAAGRAAEAKGGSADAETGTQGAESQCAESQCAESQGTPESRGAAAEPAVTMRRRGCRVAFTVRLPGCRLWSPEDPYLYRLTLQAGEDRAESYAAMRTFTKERDAGGRLRFCLNHRPYFLSGVLDQGCWPESLLTPPSDEAMIFDITQMKSMNFNLLRKHCKIEPLRWYAHCDRLGMLVWQDLVNGGRYEPVTMTYLPTVFTALQTASAPVRWVTGFFEGRRDADVNRQWIREAKTTVRLTRSMPCVACRTIFNEGWGQFRVKELTELIRRLDPDRLIDATSGWFDEGCGDFISEHNYFRALKVPEDRMHTGRLPAITEYGGVTLEVPGHVYALSAKYGYGKTGDPHELQEKLADYTRKMQQLEAQGLTAAIYTQVTDIEEEINGLLTWDRQPKTAGASDAEAAE